jgi:hypothetical protein
MLPDSPTVPAIRPSLRDARFVALALLAVGWLVLALGQVVDARRGGPEPMVRAYLTDLEAHDLASAQATLEPSVVERWRDFLGFQQFTRYHVLSVAVRSPSLLESFSSGRPWRANELTLVADIQEPDGRTWRGSTVVPLEFVSGRWLMLRPPFAPADEPTR